MGKGLRHSPRYGSVQVTLEMQVVGQLQCIML